MKREKETLKSDEQKAKSDLSSKLAGTPFPETDNVSIAFPCLTRDEMQKWETEAKKANYDTKFERMASTLFFSGGKIIPKKDIDETTYKNGLRYLKKWLGSWDPKHEAKELVAGYILSRIAEGVSS